MSYSMCAYTYSSHRTLLVRESSLLFVLCLPFVLLVCVRLFQPLMTDEEMAEVMNLNLQQPSPICSGGGGDTPFAQGPQQHHPFEF